MLGRTAANRQTLETAAKAVLLLSLFTVVAPFSNSPSDSIEAWESKALKATDPDVDVMGLADSSPRLKRAIGNSARQSDDHPLESIESWETKALRATDPDLDAMDRIPSDRSQQRLQKQAMDENIGEMNGLISDASLNVSPDIRATASDGSRVSSPKAQLGDIDHASHHPPTHNLDTVGASHPQEQQLETKQSSKPEKNSAPASPHAPKAAAPAISNLPAQIKEVRNFLLGLQTQVHRDARESARSLADLQRVYRSQDRNRDADADTVDSSASATSTRPGTIPSPPSHERAHREQHPRRPPRAHAPRCAGGRDAPRDGGYAQPDEDTRSALDAADAADAQARRLVARSRRGACAW